MNVAIAGYGMEGKVNLTYWQARGATVTVLDEREHLEDVPAGVMVITGHEAFNNLLPYDMVIRTASLHPDKLAAARKVWSATNEFFAQCPAPIIGVTGTKGKGTTSSLIASLLESAGKTVHLVGNIGVPALEVLPKIAPEHFVVFEMSSFQLWDLEKSPQLAVVLMVEPDHLDIHKDVEEYVNAKAHITMYQTENDRVIYHPTNELSHAIAMAGAGKKMRYLIPDDGGVYIESNHFFVQNEQICSLDALRIPGWHNVENACAAITAVLTDNKLETIAQIETGLRRFAGLPHRLKFIREVRGVSYFDDNYSSAPGAAIAALRSFTQPEILILGGYDKGADFTELAQAIAAQPNIKKCLLMGSTRHDIAAALNAVGRSALVELEDESMLEPIIKRAQNIAEPGDVIVMSPGCASFDMFKNFTDRGDQFIRLVEGLK